MHRHALEALRQDPAVQDVLRLPLTPGKPILSIVDGGQVHFKARLTLPAYRVNSRVLLTCVALGLLPGLNHVWPPYSGGSCLGGGRSAFR